MVRRSRDAVMEAIISAEVQIRAQNGWREGVDQPPAVTGAPQERLFEEFLAVVVKGLVL